MSTGLVRPKPGTITIAFGPESDYEGVEVTLTRRVSLETALQLAERFSGDGGETRDAVAYIGDHFILDWNLADDGPDGDLVKAPISGARLLAEGAEFGTRIARTFTDALVTLNPQTPPPSINGDTSAAASMNGASSSANLASLSVPN